MEYSRLGESGLVVSRTCLGGMNFGEPSRGYPSWSLDEEQTRTLVRAALEAGVTFYDTANNYSDGSSEEFLGRALASHARREDVVIATKVYERVGPLPNGRGLSRGAILTQIDASLRRLGTDYIDLYIIHRADPSTPWEETLETLDGLVHAGKVRYLGASAMRAWQFAKARFLQDKHGWGPFISMQSHFKLLYREEEREMQPLCLDQGVGMTPFSPLAKGMLTRAWGDTTARAQVDETLARRYGERDKPVVDAVVQLAEKREVPPAQIALAWLLHQPGVVAPVVGMSRGRHLDDAVSAVDVALSDEEIASLERPYVPHEFNWIGEPGQH